MTSELVEKVVDGRIGGFKLGSKRPINCILGAKEEPERGIKVLFDRRVATRKLDPEF